MWGDLVKGQKAVTRRTLVGFRAHECMYAWVYLTDYMAVKALHRSLINSGRQATRSNVLSPIDKLDGDL